MNHSPILLATSSFTATGWQGSFYPKGLRPADYLSYYAQHFDTVEIDSTFYATPNVSVVRSNAKTPEGFLFAAKVLQEITRKRVLKDCTSINGTLLGSETGPRLPPQTAIPMAGLLIVRAAMPTTLDGGGDSGASLFA